MFRSPSGMRRLRARLAVIPISAALTVGLSAGPAAAYSVVYNLGAGIAATVAAPGSAPPGANVWTCKPTTTHPYPVVLVHGTFGNMTDSWQAGSALLSNKGYCVFALDYGAPATSLLKGYGDIATSAGQLATFITKVLSATGATKVDIVGHSQGGMMPRYYIKFLGGASTVHRLVALAPSSHGTTLDGLTTTLSIWPGGSDFVASLCVACAQQVAGSSFMSTLNSGGDTVAGVLYTVIETKYDEVVTPYTTSFLSGSNVTNITLQNSCALDLGDHIAIMYDRVAWGYVLNALDPANATTPPCALVLPGIGG